MEGLIKWDIIKNQEQISTFCKIMREAQGKEDARSYVMTETLKRIEVQIDIYNPTNAFGTVASDVLVNLF